MNILPWTPDYAIGVYRLDVQHQEMLEQVNRLFESLLQGTNTRELDSYITELRRKSENHFKTEETAMAETAYPDAPAHKALHAEFLKEIDGFEARARKAAGTLEMYDLTRELSRYLKGWLQDHICVHDKALGRYLNQKGIH